MDPGNPPRSSSSIIWRPSEPGLTEAPTTATERALSMCRRAFPSSFTGRRARCLLLGERLVLLGHLVGLPAGDAVDPSSTVRGAGPVVQASDGGAVVGISRSGPHVEQLIHRQLSVEDVATDQAEILLHVVGADHLTIDDGGLEVGRKLRVGVDDPVRVLLQL